MTVALVTGRADAGVIAGPPMGYEDVAPMPVIVTAAGGRVTDLNGAPVLEGDMSVLVTNGRLHEGFLKLVVCASITVMSGPCCLITIASGDRGGFVAGGAVRCDPERLAP
jgi:hypothetical protein